MRVIESETILRNRIASSEGLIYSAKNSEHYTREEKKEIIQAHLQTIERVRRIMAKPPEGIIPLFGRSEGYVKHFAFDYKELTG